MAVIPEQPPRPDTQVIVTEMEIAWSGWNYMGYQPNPNDCAFDTATRKLREIGYGNSLLKLVSNTTTYDQWNLETGLQSDLTGRAIFQVTLIPQRPGEVPAQQRSPAQIVDDRSATSQNCYSAPYHSSADASLRSFPASQAPIGFLGQGRQLSYDSHFDDP